MSAAVAETAARLAKEGFSPVAGGTKPAAPSHPAWAGLRALGTRLWLDTGDLDAAAKLWTEDFTNLTTNNTLVNKEVQKGLFDELIPRAGRALRDSAPELSTEELVTEVGFVVNCQTALRLVEAFDATVSVELHPAMAHDAARSVEYGRRYFAVCPEKFIVKVPMTAAGFLAAKRLAEDGIPVNYTLGFSARQNVLAADFSRTAFVNVFMGRLNSFVADHGLGDGKNVGEKATMATQMALREGRDNRGWSSLLIGASLRSGQQIAHLAGLDVFTMPPAAAEEFTKTYDDAPTPLHSRLGTDFPVHAEPEPVLSALWDIPKEVYRLGDKLAAQDTSGWVGQDLATFARDHACGFLFHPWTDEQLAQIRSDGKIPSWPRWKDDLTSGRLALDDLLSVSALQSFVTDQQALDQRIERLLHESGVA